MMSETTAEASVSVDAAPEAVWDALTDPAAVKQYFMGATVTTDWNVGSPITWAGEWKGQPYEDKGEILEFDAPRRLSMSHWSPMGGTDDAPENYHVLDIELEPVDGRTRVTLQQSNLEGGITDADRASRDDYEKNWSATLDGLKAVVEKSNS